MITKGDLFSKIRLLNQIKILRDGLYCQKAYHAEPSCLGGYSCRWTIEVWHRVLKTGCRIESRQLETADRLSVALTLYSIIAWRILYATMLARTAPNLPCTVVLRKEEWQALYCNVNHVSEPTAAPPSLGEAVLWLSLIHIYIHERRQRQGDRTHDQFCPLTRR